MEGIVHIIEKEEGEGGGTIKEIGYACYIVPYELIV